MEKNVLNSMFDNLLHIWNKTNFWNAKMKSSIYWSVNWIHVINLLSTWAKLEAVKSELKDLSESGKKILFVATKIQSRDAFKKLAEETGHFYVCEKWVPGLLTNFKTIRKRINSYIQLVEDVQTGALEVLTKKEKASKLLELEKLEKAYSWLKEMKKLPDVVFTSDWIYEKQSLREAEILNIKSFAIFNTNGDVDLVSNYIPANTNSVKSFEYLSQEIKNCLGAFKVAKKATIKVVDQTKVSGEKSKTTEKKSKEEILEETTEV